MRVRWKRTSFRAAGASDREGERYGELRMAGHPCPRGRCGVGRGPGPRRTDQRRRPGKDPDHSRVAGVPRHIARGTERRSLYREQRSEEHTAELQSLMRISYAVFCLHKKKHTKASLNTKLKYIT